MKLSSHSCHVSGKTAGVFHLRSPEGKYKLNFSQADAACQSEGAVLTTLKQMGDAQQVNPLSEATHMALFHRPV